MKFRIHGKWPSGEDDFFDLEGDSVEEIGHRARKEAEKRGWTDLWSEEVK